MYRKNALPKNTNIAIMIVGCNAVRKYKYIEEKMETYCSFNVHSIDRVQKHRGGIMDAASEIGKKDAEACPSAQTVSDG